MLKAGGNITAKRLQKLLNHIWKQNKSPKQFKRGIIVKLPKKGNLRDPNNWRAFDSVHQEPLWEILKSYGIPTKIIEIIKSLYEDAESCVKVNEEENTAWFKIKTKVRQRCILSPLLFIITIDWILQKALKDQKLGIKLNYKQEIEDLDFADDIVLIADNTRKMQEKTDRIDTRTKSIGLKINAKKTNIMV
ncbi:unnamed protein product, partial [Didymodactylos carnosus]